MSLQLQIINIPEGELLADTLYRIPASGGLIGRAPECTVPLPDNSRFLSSRHARVFQEDTQWLIEDLSTNGLLINNASSPLGPGKRHTLTDGDILTCGEYRIMVNLFSPEISLTSCLADTLEAAPLNDHSSDDPFSTSPSQFSQATAMVLDDPFSDLSSEAASSNVAPRAIPKPVEADHIQAESISFGRDKEAPSIDQLAGDYQPTAHQPDSSSLIDVLGDAPAASIPAEANIKNEIIEPVREAVIQPEPDVQQPVLTPTPIQRVEHSGVPVLSSSSQDTIFQLQEENRQLREQLKKKNKLVKKVIYHAMGQALEQTLMDFSPEYLEKLFDDYSGKKRGLFRKRNNWELYGRHFQRIMKEQTCRLAFTARFQAALRKLQEKTP
ncbi:FHA domain-containing protein [Sansalvadorimonas sp. 2012CJ34-2]|uniref:FHA domain-containing protein n=1 Tax=Parendozoicomonas callyspongiae TaxID=2942213 RepID=A0ABT0PL83_9GAMM|nr:FHA domain-containing protein [Sansalvadorimonas sp. 2012CJ34-2]MCL6272129.1 FHA domain-containing protein [Sansalvadorimonas sp. 2012CJ34-2]